MKTLQQFLTEAANDFNTLIGKGVQAKVYSTADHSGHDVRVWTTYNQRGIPNKHTNRLRVPTSPEHDSKAAYLRMSQKESQSNPHFPRVRFTRTKDAQSLTPTITAQVERLHPLKSFSADERRAMWHHAFGEESKGVPRPSHFADQIWLGKNDLSKFKGSDHMKAALTKIHRLKNRLNKHEKENYSTTQTKWDIHTGNIMGRRTPHGPQLVLTDPVVTIKHIR